MAYLIVFSLQICMFFYLFVLLIILIFFRFYSSIRMVVRILFVTVNNLYCIPVHLVWLMVLQPLRRVAASLYWQIEGIFFRWLLSMVAFWSYSGSYHIVELGDDVSTNVTDKVSFMIETFELYSNP